MPTGFWEFECPRKFEHAQKDRAIYRYLRNREQEENLRRTAEANE